MIIANTRELHKNQRKYLDLAKIQKVFIKRGHDLFELRLAKTMSNPSPSGDSFWDNQSNIEELERRVARIKTEAKESLDLDKLDEFLGL